MSFPNFSEVNSRNIFTHITDKRAMFLCLDALDFKKRSTGEPAPRMKVRCCNYDKANSNGAKITEEVDAYIPIGEFLVFCHNLLSGVYSRQKTHRQTTPSQSKIAGAEFYSNYGGSYGDPIISTKFSLVPGMGDAEFAFLATAGPGQVGPNGSIRPAPCVPGGVQVTSIFINMPNDKLKEFCLIGKTYIEQYVALDLQARLSTIHDLRAKQ